MRCLVAFVLAVGCSGPAPDSTTFALHRPGRLARAVEIGGVDGQLMIDLVFAMKRRPGTDVRAFIGQQERGVERFLTPAEFGDRFAPLAEDYQGVINWLHEHDIEVVRAEPGRTTLTARATVAAVEAAFNPQMRMFRDKVGTFRAPTREPELIARELAPVAAIAGLDDAALFRPHHIDFVPVPDLPPQPDPNAAPPSGSPADIQLLYGADQVTAFQGEGETIAILGTGYPPRPTQDVDSFIKKFMLATDRKSQYAQVFVGGPNRDSDSLAQNEYGEAVLDIDMVLATAPMASVIQVTTATNGALFESGISYIVNYIPEAHAASISYGFCERYAAPYVTPFDFMFEQAKAQGLQFFVSSGDYGSDGCGDLVPNAVLSIDYPSGSPFVISVGGTQETNTAGEEVVWNGHSEKDLGGGGQSQLYDKPAYQVGVGPYPNDGVRDVPDVSALASGNLLVIAGTAYASGGTSASAPIWAGLWARLDQSQGGGGIRNAHERLYELGKAGIGFKDITKGDISWMSPGYDALPGFDLATGWGSPKLPDLIANWK
jgi:kumamolisin